jgi:glycosyltransferase involved in cell wall biosynthesis
MKVVFVSSLLPSGHYSQYLTQGLNSLPALDLIVYSDKDPGNLKMGEAGRIKTVWSKSLRYIPEILRELTADKPDIVHFQHEINMFGGPLTAVCFPLLLLLVKLKKIKQVVTVHCAIPKVFLNKDFSSFFHKDSFFTKPVFLKIFFSYLYKMISLCSDQAIVHTHLTKSILVNDYGFSPTKINVIPPSIPVRSIKPYPQKKYFFYFGYIVKRKGLHWVLSGFRKFLEKNPNSSFRLVIAGGTIPGQEQAERDIKELILQDTLLRQNVDLKGFVEEAALDDLYGHADAVVVPAEMSMGASGPLYHAFSFGKCVLASKIGHLTEEIDHLTSGYLVDNDQWQEGFQFCLDRPDQVALIEKNVIEITKSRTPFLTAQKHLAVYNHEKK